MAAVPCPACAAVAFVGRLRPAASRSCSPGIPDTKQSPRDVFVNVNMYVIDPAPALPRTSVKLPPRSLPRHADAADGASTVVVSVTVVVTVWVTVTVLVDPHPATETTTRLATTTSLEVRSGDPGT